MRFEHVIELGYKEVMDYSLQIFMSWECDLEVGNECDGCLVALLSKTLSFSIGRFS